MAKYLPVFFLAMALVFLTVAPSEAQDAVDENGVVKILQATYKNVVPADIEIKMIKALSTRTKVNLSIKKREAVLYLTMRRVRGEYKWWFETSPERSLIFLERAEKGQRLELNKAAARQPKRVLENKSKDPFARTDTITFKPGEKTIKDDEEEAKPEPEKQPEETTVETVEVKEVISDKTPDKKETVSNKPVDQTPEEFAEPESKPEKMVTPPDEKPDDKNVEPSPEIKEKVVEEKPTEPATVEEKQTDSDDKKEPEVQAIEKPEPRTEKPSQMETNETESKPVEKESKPELENVEEIAKEPVKSEEVVEEQTREEMKATPVEQPKKQVPDTVETEAARPKPMSLEMATGPGGSAQDFITAFVYVVSQGANEKYEKFLFQPTEMAIRVHQDDFQRGIKIWKEQFDRVFKEIKKADKLEVQKIFLQKPQTKEIERVTLASLQERLTSVRKIYTYVKINLLLDGSPAYISIGGLIETDFGWRIGGRVELVHQIAFK